MSFPTSLLTRVLCVIFAMVGLDITVTPPHPPPPKEEEAPSTSWEILVKQRCGPKLVKLICWFASFSELVVIAARAIGPTCDLSRRILGILDGKRSIDFVHASPLCIMGAMLAVLGGMIRHLCYRELGSLFTFEMSIKRGHRLVTTGPYSLARHPGYTGVLCTVVGVTVLHIGPGSWARECGILESKVGMTIMCTYLALTGLISFGLLSRMAKEDEALRDKFKEEWEEWARRVPWRLVPRV
ncbi:hypothetical protein L218DRAFT_901163, partial [Marasmius fiardii PR-910]